MSLVKVNDQYGNAKYHIQLEKINYVEYVKSNSLFGEGHYEVVFSGEGQLPAMWNNLKRETSTTLRW